MLVNPDFLPRPCLLVVVIAGLTFFPFRQIFLNGLMVALQPCCVLPRPCLLVVVVRIG